MNLRRCILTENPCYKAGKRIKPAGIVVHSTGANNPYLRRYIQPDDGYLGRNANNNHWNQDRPDLRVCVHAFIGRLKDGTIATYQTLPWDMRGWHVGGSANNTHIGFEICEDGLSDRAYFDTVYQEAVELCAYLCKGYDIEPDNIIDHSEAYKLGLGSNHMDVSHWFHRHGKTMSMFRRDVKDEMAKMTGEEIFNALTEYLSKLPPSPYAEKTCQNAIKSNLFKDEDKNGSLDRPRSFVTREELATVLERAGMFDR